MLASQGSVVDFSTLSCFDVWSCGGCRDLSDLRWIDYVKVETSGPLPCSQAWQLAPVPPSGRICQIKCLRLKGLQPAWAWQTDLAHSLCLTTKPLDHILKLATKVCSLPSPGASYQGPAIKVLIFSIQKLSLTHLINMPN